MVDLRKKLDSEPEGSFHVLGPEKALRMKAATMYLPSPHQVRDEIMAIPFGQTRTTLEIRERLAKAHGAETTCPATVTKYWKWIAGLAHAEPSDAAYGSTPYWRVLKDGKLSDHLPGGKVAQAELLRAEGVRL